MSLIIASSVNITVIKSTVRKSLRFNTTVKTYTEKRITIMVKMMIINFRFVFDIVYV